MSHQATTWAWGVKDITSTERLILLALANRHNPDFGCYPSLKRVGLDCGFSIRAVRRAVRVFEIAGIIESNMRYGQTTRYVLAFEGADSQSIGADSQSESADSQSESADSVAAKPVKEISKQTLRANFKEFFALAFHQGNEEKAFEEFERALIKTDFKTIITAWRQYCAEKKAEPKRFIAKPENWLKGKKWRDLTPPAKFRKWSDLSNTEAEKLAGAQRAHRLDPDAESRVRDELGLAPASQPVE